MASLSLRGLAKRFGNATALHPTDLEIEDGEFVVLIGPSGCGKSTLLRLIAGLEEPSEGQVLIGGQDVTGRTPVQRDIAMVFQSYALYPHLSVAKNIGFPLRMSGARPAEIAAKVRSVADLLELTPLLDRLPRTLSGGQRQRVSIGRAIVRDPAVLLLDEPLSNLDADLRVRLRYEFARLHQRLGVTMVYVTHDQVEAMTLANRVVVMREGRIEQVGSPSDLYHRPATLRVAQAIGSPAINTISARVVAVNHLGARVALEHGGGELLVHAQLPPSAIGNLITLGVRPEHLRPDDAGPFGGPVVLFEQLGPLSFAHAGEGGSARAIVAQLPGDSHVQVGDTVFFSAAPGDIRAFDEEGVAFPRLSP